MSDRVVRASDGTKVPELVARRIAHEIASRRLEPGTRLPHEQEMMSSYGVGRSSLREALRILEVQGILRIKSGVGGGPIVEGDPAGFSRMTTLHLQLRGTTLRDLLEVRRLMEPMMAWHAARTRNQDAITRLRRSVDGTREDLAPDADYMRRSGEFHRVLTSTSANPALDLYCSSPVDLYVSRITGMHFPKTQRESVHQAHSTVLTAIEAGDADEARSLMEQHMDQLVGFAERRFSRELDELMSWQ